MVRRLRKRSRADARVNQARRTSGSWARRVYLAMLAALALSLTNYVWGDMVLLRADGILMRERSDIAASSLVRVEAVYVRRGQQVAAGDLLLRVGSAEILDAIADQTVRIAELARQEAALRSRISRTEALLPLARRRADSTARAAAQLGQSATQGLVTTERLAQALADEYDAQANVAALTAESVALDAEIATLAAAHAAATAALNDLKAHYGNGEIRATVTGTVGIDAPAVGEVFAAGSPLLSIFSGPEHVLAYLPGSYLFAVEQGMGVRVSDGRRTATGEIEEILTISESLPEEFRTAFRPGDRRQLARIRLIGPHSFPVLANVRVSRDWPFRELSHALTQRFVRQTPSNGDDARASGPPAAQSRNGIS